MKYYIRDFLEHEEEYIQDQSQQNNKKITLINNEIFTLLDSLRFFFMNI